MRVLLKTSATFAVLLAAGSMVPTAAVADPSAPNVCTYKDLKYSPGAMICVAPSIVYRCGGDGWGAATGDSDFKTACAAGQIPAPGASATATTPPGLCMYHDVQYAPGAVICVGPGFGQTCGTVKDNVTNKDGVWSPITSENNLKVACANAQIPAPATSATSTTTPPGLCTYHDVHYAFGAVICVAPKYGQTCGDGGKWSSLSPFEAACANAQIPAPTGPPTAAK